MDIWGISDIGDKREINQDRISICRNGDMALLTVADGMGGMDCGEAASQIFVDEIEKWWTEYGENLKYLSDDKLKDALSDEISNINRKLYAFCLKEKIRTGTTASLLFINGSRGIMAYSGDTRIYRITPDNRAELLSEDENLYSYIEKNPIEGKNTERNKSIMLSYIGRANSISVSLKNLEINNGDIFIIATDGFYRYYDFEKPENIALAYKLSAKGFSEAALAEAMKTRVSDNLSMIIIKYGEDLWKRYF